MVWEGPEVSRVTWMVAVPTSSFLETLLRALAIGAFGGAGLILTQLYSRRGPAVFPVYSALVVLLGAFLVRASPLGFLRLFIVSFLALMLAVFVSTAGGLLIATRVIRAKQVVVRQRRPLSDLLGQVGVMVLAIGVASVGIAYVVS